VQNETVLVSRYVTFPSEGDEAVPERINILSETESRYSSEWQQQPSLLPKRGQPGCSAGFQTRQNRCSASSDATVLGALFFVFAAVFGYCQSCASISVHLSEVESRALDLLHSPRYSPVLLCRLFGVQAVCSTSSKLRRPQQSPRKIAPCSFLTRPDGPVLLFFAFLPVRQSIEHVSLRTQPRFQFASS
jgi:hypothetical protein